MRAKCLAQEHNTMSPARARTRSARSGVERTNHEVTAINKFTNRLEQFHLSVKRQMALHQLRYVIG